MAHEPATSGTTVAARKATRRLFVIETFTLRFDAMEDRLRIDATDKAGSIEGIWLTQRLTNKLVAALAQDLDRELAAGLVEKEGFLAENGQERSPASPPKLPPPAVAATLHGMAQQRLRLARAEASAERGGGASSQAPKVRNAPGQARWLCTMIQLGPRPGGVMVSFSDDSRVTARFYMSHRNARAVLDGLADHYRKADWPLKAFPDWVQDAGDVSENLGQGRVLN
ncbi:MAG: hypothetical protein HLUCCA05_13985 [Roseibaca calidilacus]|uniref:Uncharacterized protein n=1 Tax=Roseibaca calidilacus TaxID=1666912 RepID=A0A0P7YNN7_9RHOB|nr:hypothetical protein [Roseibaca calidilacus]KPP90354.1 MAG: hypothetical protein HLUCCA05_13985 [Roseibaca calidilacus]CUX80734.1 hypothetical protein Ga0058931_1302 [Roseibaca calidilacus]